MRDTYKILLRHPKGKDCLQDLGIDEVIILKWILKKQGVRM
jgi:hypothetical protein